LESEGLKLDRKYLGSLLNDIYVERSKRANTWMLNQALSAFQDVMMEISAVASSIANDEFARKQDPAQRRWHSRSHGTQMLRQGDADVFKLYSQAKLGMMREALTKLDRRANERGISSTERAS
jgi:hypothetical protein